MPRITRAPSRTGWCALFFRAIVWSLGRGGFPAALESVALAVHLQDVDVVGEPVQQRDGQALQAEDLDERFRSGGVQRDKPNSSMISRLSWDRFRWKFSSRLSSLAPSGPLYLVFTGATPQRGSPAGVLRQHGVAGLPVPSA